MGVQGGCGVSCFGDEGNRQEQEERGKTSKASDGCFILGLAVSSRNTYRVLSVLHSAAALPKGSDGQFLSP